MGAVELPVASEIANLLAANYIERRDMKARQWEGGYSPVVVDPRRNDQGQIRDPTRLPLKKDDLIEHIQGVRTYGHYVVSLENKCRMFAFDLDLNKSCQWTNKETGETTTINPREVWRGPTTPEKRDLAMQLKALAHGLAMKVHTLIECKVTVHYSGAKGMHVIGCLERGTPASDAREMAYAVIESFDCFDPSHGKNFFHHRDPETYPALEIEVFPKQDEVREENGSGNLLRLPLGVNLKTGNQSFFIDFNSDWSVIKVDDPIRALTEGSIRGC